MPLKLMYITNQPEIAQIAENAGVDRIFVDMEYIGKDERQHGLDTVQSHHTIEDVIAIRAAIHKSEVLVRVNPIHEASPLYSSSKEEIDAVVRAGADVVMLPFFKNVDEVANFIRFVGGRAKTLLLFETPESIAHIDSILTEKGIDEVFIGLNDLSLGYGYKFMFQLLANGTVERICLKFKQAGYAFGFGGIASLRKGMLPSEYIIREHYKFGSTCTILSRSFCNIKEVNRMSEITHAFESGVKEIRQLEQECQKHIDYFVKSEKVMRDLVHKIVDGLSMNGNKE